MQGLLRRAGQLAGAGWRGSSHLVGGRAAPWCPWARISWQHLSQPPIAMAHAPPTLLKIGLPLDTTSITSISARSHGHQCHREACWSRTQVRNSGELFSDRIFSSAERAKTESRCGLRLSGFDPRRMELKIGPSFRAISRINGAEDFPTQN